MSKLGILPDIGISTILLAAFSLWLLFDGIRYLQFLNITFALAFLYIIFDKPLNIDMVSPWTALTVALLSGIGLSMLFGRKKRNRHAAKTEYDRENQGTREHCSGKDIYCENSFGSAIRYINSDDLCNACVENSFGTTTVYFDNAIIQEELAEVKIENNFGSVMLFIPKEWKVQKELDHCFGSINEYGMCLGTGSAALRLHGETNFGTIEIHYV